MIKQILFFCLCYFHAVGQTPSPQASPAPAVNPAVKTNAPGAKAEKPTNAATPDASLAVGYTKEYVPTVYKTDDCLVKNKIEICLKLIEQKKTENKQAEGIQFSRKLCELKAEYCAGLYKAAAAIGADGVASIQKFLEDGCSKTGDTCNELALLNEANKHHSEAINFARKYYLKFQKGDFLRLAHAYGDKNEAFAAALAECTRNNSTCTEFMKNMSDSPQLSKFADQAEKYCNSAKAGDSKVADVEATCARIGSYYDARKRYEKATEVLQNSCKRAGAKSCVLMIGSVGIDPAKQLWAFGQLCAMSAEMSPSIANVKRMNCSGSQNEIPKQLKIFSVYELKKASDEFKSAP